MNDILMSILLILGIIIILFYGILMIASAYNDYKNSKL